MREILFKAKRVDNGEWIIAPAFMTLKNETESCTKMLNFRRNGNSTIEYNEEILFHLDGVIIDPETICQYTGLKNLHEHDFIRFENGAEYEIIWEDFMFKIANETHREALFESEYEDWEKTGNRFD